MVEKKQICGWFHIFMLEAGVGMNLNFVDTRYQAVPKIVKFWWVTLIIDPEKTPLGKNLRIRSLS